MPATNTTGINSSEGQVINSNDNESETRNCENENETVNPETVQSETNTFDVISPVQDNSQNNNSRLTIESRIAELQGTLINSTDASAIDISPIQRRTRMDDLPPVNIIPHSLRAAIQSHRYVNLSQLLIPGMDVDNETRIIDDNGTQIVVKASDSRLHRQLNIHEFRTAFSKYKNVLCETEPNRRQELDSYCSLIDSMFQQYGGHHFYDYHVAFARKAAEHEGNKIAMDWSFSDTKLYLRVFLGLRSASCDICQSTNHTTSFCPRNSAGGKILHGERFLQQRRYKTPYPDAMSDRRTAPITKSSYPHTLDRQGRKRVFHNEKELCNNFNYAKCNLQHSNTNVVHLCELGKLSHPSKACPSSGLSKGK